MCHSTDGNNGLKAPGHPIYAWLEIDGKKAKVYEVQTEGKVVSCWFESQVGSEFARCYRLGGGRPEHDIAGHGRVDGSDFANRFTRANDACFYSSANSFTRQISLEGTDISANEVKRIIFTPIVFTSNAKLACRNEAIINGLGTIGLTLRYGTAATTKLPRVTPNTGPNDQTPIYMGLKKDLDMTERAKHGRTTTQNLSSYHFDYFPGESGTICEFKFYYRSKEILERKGIIKETGSASDLLDIFTLISASRSNSASPSSVVLDRDINASLEKIRHEGEQLRSMLSSRSSLTL